MEIRGNLLKGGGNGVDKEKMEEKRNTWGGNRGKPSERGRRGGI